MAVYKIDGFGTRNQTDGSGFDINRGHGQRFVTLYSEYTITKGMAVAFDFNSSEPENGYGLHVIQADGDVLLKSQVIGIATETVAGTTSIPVKIKIQVGGYCDAACTDLSACSPGQLLVCSNATDHASSPGILAPIDTSAAQGSGGEGDQLPCAIHIADGSGDTVADSKVYLLNPANL